MNIFRKIRRVILRFRIKNYQKKNPREKQFLNIRDIHSMLILVYRDDSQNLVDDLRHIISTLLNKHMVVKVVLYNTKNVSTEDFPDHIYELKKSHVRYFHGLRTSITNRFHSHNYDVLMNLSCKDNTTFEYLAGISNCKMNVGVKTKYVEYYDFLLDTKGEYQNIGKSFDILMSYLEQINK